MGKKKKEKMQNDEKMQELRQQSAELHLYLRKISKEKRRKVLRISKTFLLFSFILGRYNKKNITFKN